MNRSLLFINWDRIQSCKNEKGFFVLNILYTDNYKRKTKHPDSRTNFLKYEDGQGLTQTLRPNPLWQDLKSRKLQKPSQSTSSNRRNLVFFITGTLRAHQLRAKIRNIHKWKKNHIKINKNLNFPILQSKKSPDEVSKILRQKRNY